MSQLCTARCQHGEKKGVSGSISKYEESESGRYLHRCCCELDADLDEEAAGGWRFDWDEEKHLRDVEYEVEGVDDDDELLDPTRSERNSAVSCFCDDGAAIMLCGFVGGWQRR
ncbi:likely protein kinase [Pseudozyma hubeiensis SY62]|uniref:Likely protein kinase n=1 Tax=Pseudozyma hubeiensis (strain SY62) TaxID=1305764 RepID=R9P7S7_PSEHS|nr:likely protein kinase [Pseudozyma hubeiensis SY62]GAC97406.1 likely protein kinase [Pseudozyma hubeiensis SY62]